MESAVIGVVAIVLGFAVGWLTASSRASKTLSDSRIDAEGKIQRAASTIEGLRLNVSAQGENLTKLASETEAFRERLKAEGELRVAAETELRQLKEGAEETKALRELLRTESESRVAAETRLAEAQASFAEQRLLLEQARAQLTDAFGHLSAEALRNNNEAFLVVARGAFERLHADAKGELEARKQAVDAVIGPIRETLERYERQIQEMEERRQNAYGALDEHLRGLAAANLQLQRETGNLVTALRTPQVRGRWGEMTLRRVAELAGMSEHCDFVEQETLEVGEARQRPDMIVNLPGGRRIVVDAKAPLQAFIDAAAAVLPEERDAQMSRHGSLVRAHMNQLGARSYWEQFDRAPELVVLFLPGESFFAAALETDRTLIEDGMEKRVIIATPTTLIALLRAVAYGWRQEQIAASAQAISDMGKQLYDRIRTFLDHYTSIGETLERAVISYNRATASLESRILPSARKFKEYGAATGEELAEISSIDSMPRALETREGSPATSSAEIDQRRQENE